MGTEDEKSRERPGTLESRARWFGRWPKGREVLKGSTGAGLQFGGSEAARWAKGGARLPGSGRAGHLPWGSVRGLRTWGEPGSVENEVSRWVREAVLSGLLEKDEYFKPASSSDIEEGTSPRAVAKHDTRTIVVQYILPPLNCVERSYLN